MLAECYDVVDYISLHSYHDPTGSTPGAYLAGAFELDRAIDGVVATVDHVAARLKSRKRLHLAVDEWNVWYFSRWTEHDLTEWPDVRPLIEDTYNELDATMVASLLITLLRHADRVGSPASRSSST